MPVTVFTDAVNDQVAPGVTRSRIEPGGAAGPNNVVHESEQIGGGTWSQIWSLGRPEDPWRMLIPDVRMAPNQLWPLHWHDTWTAVVVLDGGLLMGDWWMEPGDVLIAAPGVEYGPLVNGPRGCQILEIFARDILSPGGYGQEYHDHPTLKYVKGLETTAFLARPPALPINGTRSVAPVEETEGLSKGRLDGNAYFDLGSPEDPERSIVFDRKLGPGETLPAAAVGDWRALIVLDGSATVSGTPLRLNDLLLVEPQAKLPDVEVGPDGVHLLELARTAPALTR